MNLPLTPETLAAAYNYLKSTPPYKRWKLPPSGEVLFRVAKTRREQGWYQWNGKQHTITASEGRVAQTTTLLVVMAHEMIHLYLEMTDQENKSRNCGIHNAAFKKYASRVCRVHGWDPKTFY